MGDLASRVFKDGIHPWLHLSFPLLNPPPKKTLLTDDIVSAGVADIVDVVAVADVDAIVAVVVTAAVYVIAIVVADPIVIITFHLKINDNDSLLLLLLFRIR